MLKLIISGVVKRDGQFEPRDNSCQQFKRWSKN